MLRQLYEQLIASDSDHRFTAIRIEEFPGAYLAADSLQRPALFLPSAGPSAEPALRTAQVSLRLSGNFTLSPKSSEPVTGLFDCLACEASDSADIATFLVLVEAFASRQTKQPNVAEFFRSIVRLFAMSPARDLGAERLGLWGELFMMRSLNGFGFWTPYWHSEPNRRFDFSAAEKRVEVKTASGGPRIHHFSHRQVYALEGERIMIASLTVTPDDAGITLRQLIGECRNAIISTPHFLHLERAVRRAGMDDPNEAGPSFDGTAALGSLAWFDSKDVPHFCLPEPPGVSDTRYRVDLSTAPQQDLNGVLIWLREWEPVATPAA